MKQTTAARRTLVVVALLATTLVLVLLPKPTLASPGTASGQIHVVQRGDSLSGIAARYGVSMSAIMQANGIVDPNRIYIGQRLTIPGGGQTVSVASAGCPTTYRVRLGDYLGKIAQDFGVSVASIQQANGLWGTLIFPGTRLTIPCPGTAAAAPTTSSASTSRTLTCPLSGGRYLIRPGDTLLVIALRCNTSVAALRQANGLTGDMILAGQWLVISSHGAPAPAAPVAPSPSASASAGGWSAGSAQPQSPPAVAPQPTPQPTRIVIRTTTLPPTPSP